MAKAPDWTPEEFEILLRSPNEKDDSLYLQLPRRTPSSIQAVRGGIHAFHTGGKFSLLSMMMVRRLQKDTTGLVCAVCKLPLE